jgi:hypothetical protein
MSPTERRISMSEDERLRNEEGETEPAELDDAEEADVEAHGKGHAGGGGVTIQPVPPDTI